MNTETAQLLIAFLTYSVLSMMQDSFRRMLEQFLADEILSARGGSEERAKEAFKKRIAGMESSARSIERALVYCFPHARGLALGIFAALSWAIWPLSLALSIRGYAFTTPAKENGNDRNIRVRSRG